MNMSNFAKNVSHLFEENVKSESALLTGCTQFSFFKNDNGPGILTPFTLESLGDAGFELFAKAGINLFCTVLSIIDLVAIPFVADDDYSLLEYYAAAGLGMVYFPVAFVVDIGLSLVAFITRTMATLFHAVGLTENDTSPIPSVYEPSASSLYPLPGNSVNYI